MKPFIAAALIALMTAGISSSAVAQTDHSAHGTAHAPAASATATPLTDGTVKKIDKTNKKVTLSHGPLPNGMPAMTMAFRVKDVAWLDKMKEGQTIRFAAEDINGTMTVVRFEPGK
jgi:Cu(I)/Ag(I) efflux system periplasmic protein CusF